MKQFSDANSGTLKRMNHKLDTKYALKLDAPILRLYSLQLDRLAISWSVYFEATSAIKVFTYMTVLFARLKESRKDRYLLTLFGLGK